MRTHLLTMGVAIFFAGCANTAQEPEGVGSTEQALGSTSPVVAAAGTVASIGSGRIYPASCTVTVSGHTIMLVFGGYNSTGTALNDILAFDRSAGATGTWTLLSTVNANYHLTNARGDLSAISTASDTCTVVGGTTAHLGAAASLADVDTVQVTGVGPYTATITARTAMHEGRANFALTTCGTQLVAIGGRDGNLATPEKSSLEVSNTFTPTSWTLYNSGTQDLNTKRFSFGFAKDPSNDRYIVAGGGPTPLSSIELITMSSCAPTVTQVASTLPNAVMGNVLFPEGTTDRFIAAGGKTATPSVPTVVDKIDVTAWTGTPAVTVTSLSPMVLNPGTFLPTLVKVNASPLAHEILGGNNGLASYATFTANGVQQYENGQASLHFATLHSGRYGAVAEDIGSTVIYAAGASATGGTDTVLTSVEEITP